MSEMVTPTPSADTAANPKRQRLLLIAISVMALGGLVAFGYWKLVASRVVSTDNAYVTADSASITAAVGGIVKHVNVVNTGQVKAGDLLLQLDDRDARLSLDKAVAQLKQTERRIRADYQQSHALQAAIQQHEARLQQAAITIALRQVEHDKAGAELMRRQPLASNGTVSGEELGSARAAVASSQQQLQVARAEESAARATLIAARATHAAHEESVPERNVSEHPDYQLAKAQVGEAQLALERTRVLAPFDGVISKRNVQQGQRVAPGSALMQLVPLDKVYVEANFKEGQLQQVRIDQPVELHADLYGKAVIYQGRVVGFSGNTGAAMAPIPAQNATGNWIKVVQRVPLRIALDARQLQRYPLRVGLSMTASVKLVDEH